MIEFAIGIVLSTLSDQAGCEVEIKVSDSIPLCLTYSQWSRRVLEPDAEYRCIAEYRPRAYLSNPPDLSEKEVVPRYQCKKLQRGNRSKPSLGGFAFLLSWIERFRLKLFSVLKVHDQEHMVIRSLLLGARGDPSSGLYLRAQGFVHLLRETGIHFYALLAWTNFIFKWVSSKLSEMRPRLAMRRASQLSGFLISIFAWALSGARINTLIPLAIVGLRFMATRFGSRLRVFAPLFLCMAVLGSFREGGGAHYVAAVGGGLLGYWDSRDRGEQKWRQHFAMAIGSYLPIAVFDLIHYREVSPWTPILSVLTVSWFIDLWFFPVFISLWTWTDPPRWIFDTSIYPIVNVSDALKLKAVWYASPLCFLVALGLVSLFRSRNSFFILVSLSFAIRALKPETLDLWRVGDAQSAVIQWDVGQGDSALVKFGRDQRVGLIDTGPPLDAIRWMRMLASQGVTRLDFVALTHLDQDHVGGLESIIQVLPIGCVTSHPDFLPDLRLKFPNLKIEKPESCYPGFSLSSASIGHLEKPAPNKVMNAYGAVLEQVIYLSLGDAHSELEARWEREILKWVNQKRLSKSVLLKISHHGSKNSSSQRFLEAINPDLAIISSGMTNRYGHPHPVVLSTIKELGIKLWRTDLEGAYVTTSSLRGAVVRRPR